MNVRQHMSYKDSQTMTLVRVVLQVLVMHGCLVRECVAMSHNRLLRGGMQGRADIAHFARAVGSESFARRNASTLTYGLGVSGHTAIPEAAERPSLGCDLSAFGG
jgi:hypothetical protein